MAAKTYKGGCTVLSSDYHSVKWVGQTKSGKTVSIEMPNAICISNLDLSFAEKDDVVAAIEFEGCYLDGADTTVEPWTMTVEDGVSAGSGEIVLGAGLFYIDDAAVGLTRGGGSFTREIEIREINADGDHGKVKDRVVMETARPKLKLNALQWLTNLANLNPGLSEA